MRNYNTAYAFPASASDLPEVRVASNGAVCINYGADVQVQLSPSNMSLAEQVGYLRALADVHANAATDLEDGATADLLHTPCRDSLQAAFNGGEVPC